MSVHRYFFFVVIALAAFVSFSCRDERDEDVEPDTADVLEQWVSPTNMRVAANEDLTNEPDNCCESFDIERAEIKEHVLYLTISYLVAKMDENDSCHDKNDDFKIVWIKSSVENLKSMLPANHPTDLLIGKIFRCKKSSGKKEKRVKALLKIDMLHPIFSLNKERLLRTHIDIRNGCLNLKADLQYHQDEIPQIIGKETPTCKNGGYRILSAEFSGHYLKMQVTYKGSRPHSFKLVYPEVITMIHPPRFGIYLEHDAQGDKGMQTILHTFKIDLSKNPLGFSAKLIDEAELTLVNPCPPMQFFKEKPSLLPGPVDMFTPIPQVFGKSASDYQSSPFDIEDAAFNGYALKIAVRYKGSSRHEFKLVYPENILTIYPPMFPIHLVADNKGDTGNDVITETFVIDLRKNPHGFSEKDILLANITLVNASNPQQTFKKN